MKGEKGKKMNKNKNLFRIGVLVFTCVILFTGCDLLPFGKTEGEVVEPSQTPDIPTQVTPTKFIAFSTSTPTSIPLEQLGPTFTPTARLSWTPYPTRTLRPTWTPSPTLSPTTTKEVGWIIKDDFSNDEGNWLVETGSNWELGYLPGGYFLTVEEERVEITSSPGWLKLSDTRVIADVYREQGKGYWGISCRETGSASYYTIFITHEGEYGYGETRSGQVRLYPLGQSDDIITVKSEINHIMAECRGNALTLHVNDVFMFRKEVVGIGSGWVGMMAGTMDDQDKLTVVFDYIEIWGPVIDEGG